jgi:hypothetical protein
MAKAQKPTWFKGMYYQGIWTHYNGYGRMNETTGSLWRPHAFRAPGSGKHSAFSYYRSPVRGGRWFVRRTPNFPDRPWRAWSNGKAKKWSRYFEDHETAVKWAHVVAETYRKYDDEHAASILGLMLRYPKEENGKA